MKTFFRTTSHVDHEKRHVRFAISMHGCGSVLIVIVLRLAQRASGAPLLCGMWCYVKKVLERITPYTFISYKKMSVVFGTGRSMNYIAFYIITKSMLAL